MIDLQQNYGDKIQFQTLVQDYYVLCTHQNHITADDFSAPHIGVSSRREGILLEDIHLNKKKQNRQIFLRYLTLFHCVANFGAIPYCDAEYSQKEF